MARELGDPTSYLQLPTGIPVFSSDDREIGRVASVLADAKADIFDGLVVDPLHGRGERFVDAPEVASLHVGGVILTIDAATAAQLPAPGPPAGATRGAADGASEGLSARVRRAWKRVSGGS